MEKYHGNTVEYWKQNAEDDYIKTPISVLKYITVLEEQAEQLRKQDFVGQREQLLCPICSSDNVDAEFNHYNFCRDCNHDWAK
jgi:hypothetical protein